MVINFEFFFQQKRRNKFEKDKFNIGYFTSGNCMIYQANYVKFTD